MSKIKLNLAHLKEEEKLTLAATLINNLPGIPAITTAATLVANLTAARDKVTAAQAAKASAEAVAGQRTAEKNKAFDELDHVFNDVADVVEGSSGGDEATIKAAGFEVQSGATRTTSIDAVAHLSVTAGDAAGEFDWHCDAVSKAKAYQVQISVGAAPGAWTFMASATKSKGTVGGPTSGTNVWLRVQALGPNQLNGPWSDPVAKIVP